MQNCARNMERKTNWGNLLENKKVSFNPTWLQIFHHWNWEFQHIYKFVYQLSNGLNHTMQAILHKCHQCRCHGLLHYYTWMHCVSFRADLNKCHHCNAKQNHVHWKQFSMQWNRTMNTMLFFGVCACVGEGGGGCAWYKLASNHYLNQCWLIISKVLCH